MGKSTKKIELKLPDTYSLLAIYTTNDDYRLAWLLNTALDIQLQRDITEDDGFSVYADRNTMAPTHFVLIANKYDCKLLFPQYEQVNYFLLISNLGEQQEGNMANRIKTIEKVVTCSPLKYDSKLFKAFKRL